jgi:hypothetical protein
MTNTLTTCLDPALPPREWGGRAATASRLPSRLRTLFARLRDCCEDHGDYFAELERSRPEHERDRRIARREADRLLLIAMLVR